MNRYDKKWDINKDDAFSAWENLMQHKEKWKRAVGKEILSHQNTMQCEKDVLTHPENEEDFKIIA